MVKKIIQIAATMAIMLTSVVTILASNPAHAEALEKRKITIAVGGKSLFYYLPLTIAERQGYFKDEGLEVEIPDFAGGAKALQALVGGSADLVSGAFEHTINMQAKKQPIKAVVLQANFSSIALVMPKDKAAKYKSAKDLKGLKIGVTAPGSSSNMFVNNLLAKEGLKPTDVSIVGTGAGAGAVAAMDKGELDAMSNLDPVISQLEASGKYVAVADSRTERGMKDLYGGDYLASCIYATDEFIQKNPQTTQAVVNAMVRSLRWLAKATPEQIMAVVPEAYLSGNRSLYKQALLKNMIGYSTDGKMTLKAAQNVYNVLKQFEPSVIAAGDVIKLERTFDNRFVVKADAKYK